MYCNSGRKKNAMHHTIENTFWVFIVSCGFLRPVPCLTLSVVEPSPEFPRVVQCHRFGWSDCGWHRVIDFRVILGQMSCRLCRQNLLSWLTSFGRELSRVFQPVLIVIECLLAKSAYLEGFCEKKWSWGETACPVQNWCTSYILAAHVCQGLPSLRSSVGRQPRTSICLKFTCK